jgi:hypothetical protein
MHLTLKKEATKPAAANFLQQQARFDKFMDVFYNERPHEALDMKCPADVYQPSPRPYTGLPDIDYPLHDKTIVVTRCGRICLGKKKINFSQVFAGQAVGIKEATIKSAFGINNIKKGMSQHVMWLGEITIRHTLDHGKNLFGTVRIVRRVIDFTGVRHLGEAQGSLLNHRALIFRRNPQVVKNERIDIRRDFDVFCGAAGSVA